MVNVWFVCLLTNLPGPPKVRLDTGTYQLYPISKQFCPNFDQDKDTTFHLYTRNNRNESQILKTGNDKLLENSNINFEDPTVIFFHGFLESYKSADAVQIKNNYLERRNYNVILVDNERLLAGPYYITSATNVPFIGNYTAMFVDFLVSKGLQLSKLHIIGMSLGAHIAGITAKKLQSGKVARVTGLDPAGPLFQTVPPEKRLAKGDGEFVDVIHTNAGLFGISKSVGDLDVWFNGGHFQPGCDPISAILRRFGLAELVFCNHYQAWRTYVNTMKHPLAYLGVKCENHNSFEKGQCAKNDKIYVGADVDISARGNFYVDTGVTAVDI